MYITIYYDSYRGLRTRGHWRGPKLLQEPPRLDHQPGLQRTICYSYVYNRILRPTHVRVYRKWTPKSTQDARVTPPVQDVGPVGIGGVASFCKSLRALMTNPVRILRLIHVYSCILRFRHVYARILRLIYVPTGLRARGHWRGRKLLQEPPRLDDQPGLERSPCRLLHLPGFVKYRV